MCMGTRTSCSLGASTATKMRPECSSAARRTRSRHATASLGITRDLRDLARRPGRAARRRATTPPPPPLTLTQRSRSRGPQKVWSARLPLYVRQS